MPNRELREGIKDSERIACLNDAQFRLFVLLLAAADDFGRYHADPRLARSACFPYNTWTVAKTGKTLAGLAAAKVVAIYTDDGKPYLQIMRWRQRIRANRSKYPDPPQAILKGMTVTCPARARPAPGNRVRGSRIEDRGSGGEDSDGTPPCKSLLDWRDRKAALEARLAILRDSPSKNDPDMKALIKRTREAIAEARARIGGYSQ